jgi:hypothetical protein
MLARVLEAALALAVKNGGSQLTVYIHGLGNLVDLALAPSATARPIF